MHSFLLVFLLFNLLFQPIHFKAGILVFLGERIGFLAQLLTGGIQR